MGKVSKASIVLIESVKNNIYKSRENLFFHIQNVHLKQKSYACKYCENSFSHRNGLNYHLKNFHHCKIEKKKKKIKSNRK